ncbi:FHA domain-containing protein [Algiphilus sp.]|uniref:FHA domain-containing protein n=1 Tax=Algiphilus sp. TaxID=1872431 RepID=UPI0025C67235|nr:FHA domain-containing protein [Algiphilus sp.]MCK5769305.1 FHA domain-containing protein [Algiphilus sp.]
MSLRIEIIRGGDTRHLEVDQTISLGRSDQATVMLPGIAIARRHAEIALQSDLALKLRAKSPLGVEVNGRIIKEECDLYAGDRFRIGPHRGHVTTDGESSGLLLRIKIGEADAPVTASERKLDLRGAGMRMRRPAAIAAMAVLLLTLLVPLLLRVVPVPPAVATVLPTDVWWSSGRISNAHQHFADDCGACHERLFTRVRDESCLTCHAGIAHHSEHPVTAGLASLDEQRCASCHREHGNPHAALPDHPGICVDCHAEPGQFASRSDMNPVRDFAAAHPEFRATVTRRDDAGASTVRTVIGPDTRDETGFVFPHDLHLVEDGVLGPDGVEVMACRDCHRADAGEVGFKAVNFERDCQSCHQLDVSVGDEVLRLPHAEPEVARKQVAAAVEAIPAGTFAPDIGRSGRRRAGPDAERGGPPTAAELIDEVFSTRVCAKCHLVAPGADDEAEIQAVSLRQSWFVHARFTHADHGWVDCGDCHAAESSADADELLLPGIETCRTCHGGVASKQGVRSTCIDCHGFHVATESIMGRVTGGIGDATPSEEGR